VVERWRLARLRPHTFVSLAEVNAASSPLLLALHAHPCKQWPGARPQLFASLDRPALKPLPVQPYAYAEWKQVRVNIDDPVEGEGHDDSVPDALGKQPLDVRLRTPVVAMFAQGNRVARHQRSPHKGRHSPVAAPMPIAPQRDVAWTPQRFIHWAATSGPATARVVETILASRPHPHQGFRSC